VAFYSDNFHKAYVRRVPCLNRLFLYYLIHFISLSLFFFFYSVGDFFFCE
jgi:hypothetical protein